MLRLTLASFSLLIALPLLFTFNTLFMWKVTLLVGEYGHRLALGSLILVLFCWFSRSYVAMIMSALASGILLSPLVTAYVLSLSLPAKMKAAFGSSLPTNPIVWSDLWLGGRMPKQDSTEYLLPERAPGAVRRMLFFKAHSDKPAPLILVIHGGGWQNGSAEEFAEWSSQWAAEGYAVASLEYRLAPQWTWPAPLEDVQDTLAYVRQNAASLKVDASRVILLGRSAGGQIATAAAVQLHDPTIRGVVSLYAPADMEFAHRFADPEDVLDSFRLLRQYMGGDPVQEPKKYRTASATLTADSTCPPMLLIHGQRDILVWHLQSSRLAEHLRRKDVPHVLLDLPWATHAFDYPLHGPSSQLTRYAVRSFLQARFSQE